MRVEELQPEIAHPLFRGEFFLPLNLHALKIDFAATPEQLALCVNRVKSVWEHLGETKPHFSVLTGTQYLPENLDADTLESFWASGESEAAALNEVLSNHGFKDLALKVCVEFGCGVGRVSMGFAKLFSRVHAYDISTNHLNIAGQRANETSTRNAIFHACSEHFLDDIERCDFFYSVIVFQHNPPPIIASLISKALGSLRAGGIAIFQVPTYIVGYSFNLEKWLAADHALDMQMHCVPQDQIFRIISSSNCRVVEVREDNWTGSPDLYISNTFVVQKIA